MALQLPRLWGSPLNKKNVLQSTPQITGQIEQMRTSVLPQMPLQTPQAPQVDTKHSFNAWPTLPRELPKTGAEQQVDPKLQKIVDYVKTTYPDLSPEEKVVKIKELRGKYEGMKIDYKNISEVDPNTGSRYWAIQDNKNIFWLPKIPRFNDLKDTSVKDWASPLQVVKDFWINAWKSALNLWSDVANFFLDPVDSATWLLKIWAWTAVNTYETVTWDEVWGKAKEYWDVASQAVQYFKDRYGSAEAFSKSAYQDPVGVFSDIVSLVWWVGTVLKWASKIAPKVKTLQKLWDIWTDLQRVWTLDPANKVTEWMNYLWWKWVGLVKRWASYIPDITRGTLWKMTWTSSDTIKQVYQSAVEWSDEARKWLRWEIVDTDVLSNVEQWVDAIKSNRKQLYWQWYETLVKNKNIIDTNDIGREVLQGMYDDLWVTFDKDLNLDFSQSKITSRSAQQNLTDIVNDLKNWKDKTPAWLDILKQRIQDYARYTPEFAKSDRFSTMVSNKIKDKITSVVPEYKDMMKNYWQVSDLLKDIKSAISVWWNTKKNVAITKLKSVFRDNQEFRKAMIQEIEKYSGKDISWQIAWLQMSPLLPKWLAWVWAWIWVTVWWYWAVAWALSNPFTLVPLLLTSPRIVGEVANAIWVSVNKLNKYADFIKSKLPNANAVTDANRAVNSTNPWLPENPLDWWVKQPLVPDWTPPKPWWLLMQPLNKQKSLPSFPVKNDWVVNPLNNSIRSSSNTVDSLWSVNLSPKKKTPLIKAHVVDKVDDALPTAWKMEQRAKSLDSVDLTKEEQKLRGYWRAEKDIAKRKEAMLGKSKPKVKDSNVLDTLNPTWWLFVEYTPQTRATMKLWDNITTLDKTLGKSPDEMITIYRWAPKLQKSIVPWDFISTSKEVAKSYIWDDWHIISKQVKIKDVLDDIDEPLLWEESIYRPQTIHTTTPTVWEKMTQKKMELSDLWWVKTVKPNNQLKFNQWADYEAVRLVVNDKDAMVARYWALRNKDMQALGGKAPLTEWEKLEMKRILKDLWVDDKTATARHQFLKDEAKKVRSRSEQVLYEIKDDFRNKAQKKPTPTTSLWKPLPKVDDSLLVEARKYKSADERIDCIKEIESTDIWVYDSIKKQSELLLWDVNDMSKNMYEMQLRRITKEIDFHKQYNEPFERDLVKMFENQLDILNWKTNKVYLPDWYRTEAQLRKIREEAN